MSEYNHILRGDAIGCPSCDMREGRKPDPKYIPKVERRIPPGVYSALTESQFNATAHEYAGVKLVGSEEGEYVWAHGHIDPVLMAKAGYVLAREDWGILDHEDFDPELTVRHIWAVRTSPSADEWTISWAERYHDHGERFPLTLLEVEG